MLVTASSFPLAGLARNSPVATVDLPSGGRSYAWHRQRQPATGATPHFPQHSYLVTAI